MAIDKTKRKAAESNVYTALLALACGAVLAAAVFVTIMCYNQYETIFKIAGQ